MWTSGAELHGLTVQLIDDMGPSQGLIPAGALSDDLAPTLRVQLADSGLTPGDELRAMVNGVQVSEPMTLTISDFAQGYAEIAIGYIGQGFREVRVEAADASGAEVQSGMIQASFEARIGAGPGKPSIVGLVQGPDSPTTPASPIGTNDATPTIRVSLFDTGAAIGDQVLLKVDGEAGTAVVLTGQDLLNGYVDVTSSTLSEGGHLISAQVIDSAGLASPKSGAMPLVVDTTPPELKLAGVTAGDQIVTTGGQTAGHALVFQFELDDHRGWSPTASSGGPGHNPYSSLFTGVHVELFANGVQVAAVDVASRPTDGVYEIRAADLDAGHYVFTLIAFDSAGNLGFTVEPFDVQILDGAQVGGLEMGAFPGFGHMLMDSARSTDGWLVET